MTPVNLDNYVEVHERIASFTNTHPEGSLQSSWRVEEVNDQTLIIVEARAYRTPDDKRPGVGLASEPVPGKTPYTKDSELMNAETSAWGRAIAALGFEVHRGIASANEVRARNGGGSETRGGGGEATPAQKRAITTILNKGQVGPELQKAIVHKLAGNPPTKQGASHILDVLNAKDTTLGQNVEALMGEAEVEFPSDVPIDETPAPETQG